MATPPVPPRPLESYDSQRKPSAPPPVPPLPPTFKQDQESVLGSPPHFEDPLVAPRPHKLQPDLPANMARTLHEQVSTQTSFPQAPAPEAYAPHMQHRQSLNYAPGFAMPQNRPPTASPGPLPPPQGADWSPWATPQGFPSPYPSTSPYPASPYPPQPQRQDSVSSSFAALSLTPNNAPPRTSSAAYTQGFPQVQPTPPPPPAIPGAPPNHTRTSSLPYPNYPQQVPPPQQPMTTPPSPPRSSGGTPSLTAPLPTINSLTQALSTIQQPTADPARKLTWARDVLSVVDRAHHQPSAAAANAPNVDSTNIPVGPVRIGDQQLQRLVDVALPIIMQLANPQPPPNPLPPYAIEALYLRAICEASGAYPQYVPHNPRVAFRDFEQSAKSGYHTAWFKLGRDYEAFGDINHAKDCFERGVKFGVESCLYRMGMAYLMGQLGLAPSPETALPLLQRAATLATVDVPQPAYVYGLLLLQEFSHVQIPLHLFAPLIPPGSDAPTEARKHLERAAYLNFSPAQYKLGHSYEFATPPFPFDALLSVQYYSLASQQGEIEADMALSKWFLCGAEGAFEKDESLAWTFAEKAAKRGLPSAEFAMGYYAEVGVGGPKDIESARRWYTKASQHGNTDAAERLAALSQPSPQALSRQQHENLTDTTLVRKRTQARQRAEAGGRQNQNQAIANAPRIVENVRKGSMMMPPVAPGTPGGPPGPPGPPGPGGYGAPHTGSPGSMPSRLPPVDEVQSRPPTRPQQQQQQQQQYTPPHSNSTSPRMRPQQPPGGSPHQHHNHLHKHQQQQQQQLQQQQQKPFANAQRYSLADPGSGSASPAGAKTSPRLNNNQSLPRPNQSLQPPQKQQQQQQQSPAPGGGLGGPPAARPGAGKGPQTFAEMGIQGTKLEEKECVIM